MRGQLGHNTRPHTRLFSGNGCMDDLINEHSFDSQATWVIIKCGWPTFLTLSMGICTTWLWQMSCWLVQELNVCTVLYLKGDWENVSIWTLLFCEKNETKHTQRTAIIGGRLMSPTSNRQHLTMQLLFSLTLPMLRLLSSKAERRNYFWKPNKPCHVGIHWKAVAKFSKMSTHLPGFRSFSAFLHLFWPN